MKVVTFFMSRTVYYDLSFDMQKPSHVTNIQWKLNDFFPSSLGAIKVLHFTVRSEDGVGQFIDHSSRRDLL